MASKRTGNTLDDDAARNALTHSTSSADVTALGRSKSPPARALSPLANGLCVKRVGKRSAASLPRNARLQTGAGQDEEPGAAAAAAGMAAGTSQTLHGTGTSAGAGFLAVPGTTGPNVEMSREQKMLTTRILDTDEPEMVERKRRAHKNIERKRRRRKRKLEAQRRAERPEPEEPPPIDFRMYSEEEIAIISDVLAKEIDFARDMHAVERGLKQEADGVKSRSSPEPEDYSEVCVMCNRVRHCGKIEPLFGQKCLWICEGDQYERQKQLFSGGWYHQHDSCYDLDITHRMLNNFTTVRHVGLSDDLEMMARHQVPMGHIRIRLLFNEDLNLLMLGVVDTSHLDIKLSRYHSTSKIFAEVHLVPHVRCERFTRETQSLLAESAAINQIFAWMPVTTGRLDESKLQVCVWLEPRHGAEEMAHMKEHNVRRQPWLLVGMTEFPVTTVPLNDKEFVLSLYPGAGKDVYTPYSDSDGSSDEEESAEATKPQPEQKKQQSRLLGLVGRGDTPTSAASVTPPVSPEPAQAEERKRRRRRGQTNIQTTVLKSGRVAIRPNGLRWTLDVFQQVLRREKEEQIKSEQKREQELIRRELAEGNAEKKLTLLHQKRNANSLPRGLSPTGSGQYKDKKDKKKADKGKEATAGQGDDAGQPAVTAPEKNERDGDESKLLDLAEEWQKDLPARAKDNGVSPLFSDKDYRLDVSRDLGEVRRDMIAFIRKQFDDEPRHELPSRTVMALTVPVDRQRSVNQPPPAVLTSTSQEEVEFGDHESSEGEQDSEGDEMVEDERDSILQLGLGQVRQKRHIGGVPNGKLLLSLKLTGETLSMTVVKFDGMWNFATSEVTISSSLIVNKQAFMKDKSTPQPGGEAVAFNWTREFRKQALDRVLQISVLQRGPKHFLRRAGNVNVGDVLINLRDLKLQDGHQLTEWYLLLGTRQGKVFNRKHGELSRQKTGGALGAGFAPIAAAAMMGVHMEKASVRARSRARSPRPPGTKQAGADEPLPPSALDMLAKHRGEKEKEKQQPVKRSFFGGKKEKVASKS